MLVGIELLEIPDDVTGVAKPVVVPTGGLLACCCADNRVRALRECAVSHGGHAVGNDDRGQLIAVVECMFTDRGYALGNDDGGQSRAISECMIADLGYAIGNDNGG